VCFFSMSLRYIAVMLTLRSLVAGGFSKLMRDNKGCKTKTFQSSSAPCNPVNRFVRSVI